MLLLFCHNYVLLSSMLVIVFYYICISPIFDCKGIDKNESKKGMALE